MEQNKKEIYAFLEDLLPNLVSGNSFSDNLYDGMGYCIGVFQETFKIDTMLKE
jgi:hypothetical protein